MTLALRFRNHLITGRLFIPLALLLTSCVSTQRAGFVDYLLSSSLDLEITLDKAQLKPGEALVCEVILTNRQSKPARVARLDYESINFQWREYHDGEGDTAAYGPLQVATPVFSSLEEPGEAVTLAPGESLNRRFIFTRLTFERGAFALTPVYIDPFKTPTAGETGRVYSKPAVFTVAGEKAFLKRYVDGKITRKEAARLAAEAGGFTPARYKARLTIDPMGFEKWQINLHSEDEAADTVSWFVDPHLGRVWKQTEPFDESAEEIVLPRDSQITQQMRDRYRK